MNEQKPITVELRGQTCTITDVSCFEDRSVGIGWHVEDFRVKDAQGNELDVETLTEAEVEAINAAVWNMESSQDWPDYDGDPDDLPIG